MRDALRTCLQIAGGLTEATRRRTVEAAKELLDQAGIDPAALQHRIGSAIPAEVQTLADELMASGRANRDLLLGIVKDEVDKTMGRVGRVADEVTKVGVVLETLERRIRDLERPAGSAPEDAKAPPADPVPAPPVEHVRVDPEPTARPAAAPRKATSTGHKPAGPQKSVANPRRASARKHPATPARKTAHSRAAHTTPAAGKDAPAEKPATAEKTAAAKKASPRKAAAKKAAPQKAAAKKTAAPRKAAAKKAPSASAAKKSASAATSDAATPAKKTSSPKKTAPAKKAPSAKKASPAKKTAQPESPTREPGNAGE